MSKYPPNWDYLRKAIYQRDDYTCQECGDTDTELHCHHITPISKGGGHNPENLTTLCKNCHEKEHGHQIGPSEREESPGLFVYSAWISILIVVSIAIPPSMILTIPLMILTIPAMIEEIFR